MDIGKAQIDFPCPECGFINSANLNDVMDGSSLICIGCLKTIVLNDADGSTKRSVGDVDRTINDIGKIFKRGH